MAKLVWDAIGEHKYETGVDHVALYKPNAQKKYVGGVAWNGVSSISESPSGADSNPIYADNIKYLDLRSAEEFGATIECYTYPPEFAECNGEAIVTNGVVIGQQTRKTFGLAYRSIVGNDLQGNDYAYKLHLIYGATASPSEKQYSTVNDSPEAGTFSFELTTTPIAVQGYKNTASLTIDTSLFTDKTLITALEDKLFGTENAEAELPTPDEVFDLLGMEYDENTGTWVPKT
jgi:hypothetical protein